MMSKMLEHSAQRTKVAYLLLFSLMGSFLAGALLHMIGMSYPAFTGTIWYYRLTILLQDLLVMFLPAYTLYRWIGGTPMKRMGLKRTGKLSLALLVTLLVFAVSYPGIAVVARWNEQMVLPDALRGVENWMRQMEDALRQLTDLFLSGESWIDLLMNLFLVAATAAFVEEIFFRGALQQLLERWFRKGHLAVWVTAFIFSAIHLQFFGFFPRLLMGAVLGYLFLYSGNLWLPMLYHFVNNASVVVITFFCGENNFLEQLEKKPLTWGAIPVMIASGVLTYFIFLRFKRLIDDQKHDSD